MKELIVFAGEILFMAVVIGMYDKSEKFQQKIKSIKLFIEKHECIFFISMIVITIMMSVGFINQGPVSYTHLRAHETDSYLVCRLLLEKKKNTHSHPPLRQNSELQTSA